MKRFDWMRYLALAGIVGLCTLLMTFGLDAMGVPQTNLRAALIGLFGGGIIVVVGRKIGLFSAPRDD